ncbi:MAG: hypothetical protein GYA24_05990 [Candidatus Lokiarchaeota archaeon]|nr:hypothetical protein [Candidatus Lokiarchaeota archaeon]
MVDLVESDVYYLESHKDDFIKEDGGFRPVFILKSVRDSIPDKFEVDANGWGPFKSLVLRR